MDGFVFLHIKWLLNCMQIPERKVVFNLMNRKLPKQDCLMMPEYTKRIDVFFRLQTTTKLHFIFDIQFPFFSLSSKWPNLILQDSIKNKTKNNRSGDPRGTHPHRGTLGEPWGTVRKPIPGEISGNPSPGNAGEPTGSPNLKSKLKSQISIQKCMKTNAFCYDLQSPC